MKLGPKIVDFVRADTGSGPRSPSRWPTGSACSCTGAPSSGSARGERPVVLAAGRGGAGPTTKRCARRHLSPTRLPDGLAAARFACRGLAGLIAWPSAEPVFVAELPAAARQAWDTRHDDPRVAALAAGYPFLLDAPARVDLVAALARPGRGLQ